MFQGSPKDVSLHLGRMGRKVPKGENPIEHLIDVIQEYDVCDDVGVGALAEFARTGVKPPPLPDQDFSLATVLPSMTPGRNNHRSGVDGFDHSVRSMMRSPRTTPHSGLFQMLTPSRFKTEHRLHQNNHHLR